MDAKLFDYNLPSTYIAQEPLKHRDQSRLMVLDRESGIVRHTNFFHIVDLLQQGDLLVLNDSKVLPVRLYGYKKDTGGKIEALLIKPLSNTQWITLLKPGKRIHHGTEIIFSPQLEAVVKDKDEKEGSYIIDMQSNGDLMNIIREIGKMPTPPYIKKNLVQTSFYQTVYASCEGSIAAPTAGLHFTEELLTEIRQKGVRIIFLTLHIGRGTFEKIRTDQIEDHQMKAELYSMSPENTKILNQAIQDNRRIVAVGTSVTRTLESSIKNNQIISGTRWTDLFIYPGYQFRVVKILVTNFHLPRSTPLMLASAFAGREKLINAYQEAIAEKYRFYSFGDSMIII